MNQKFNGINGGIIEFQWDKKSNQEEMDESQSFNGINIERF